MQGIHELLDDVQKQCSALTDEIAAYRSARLANEALAQSLDAVCKTLDRTSKAIKPYTEASMRRFGIMLLSVAGASALISLVTLIVVIAR